MSGNPKPTAGGGPQTQRYSNQMYQPAMQTQRTDGGFHGPQYVQTQTPNQPGTSAQTLRGIPPTGPPNQASTPPTNDLKVQSVPQQSMNPSLYVTQQQQVRGTQAYYRAATGPTSQTQRMPNQHRNQQQLYPPQATQYMHMPMPQMFVANQMPYYNGQRPQPFVQPAMPTVFGGPAVNAAAPFPFTSNPTQSAAVQYPFFSVQARQGHPQQTTQLQPNPTPPLHAPMSMQAVPPTQVPYQQRQHKRRDKAIPIIDPNTGADRLDEVFGQHNNSHPPSGESSARQTPQPDTHNPSKEIQAAFAKQVAQAMGNDESSSIEETELHTVTGEHIEQPQVYHHQSPTPNRLDLVQSSNLKAHAKEFVCPSNTAKDTPIVSANCDAAEVTLPSKQAKERDSPTKFRKQHREHTQAQHQHHHQQQQQQQHQQHQQQQEKRDNSNKELLTGKDANGGSAAVDKDVPKNVSDNTKPKETSFSTTSVPVTIKEKETTSQRDDNKKSQRKDIKTDSKVPSTDSEILNNTSVQQSQSVPEVVGNAKSKNAAQRANKEQQQQQKQTPSTVPQKVAPTPIPQPQPAKPNNKTNKKSELNQKGANKEGTDMDAFNDNVKLDNIVNANLNANNDILNANTTVLNENNANNTTTVVPTNINETNKKNCNSETVTIKQETTTTKVVKNRVDVTDIVKDKPKPIKVLPIPAEQPQDEPDRAALLTNEKLVQVKNEVNSKAFNDNTGSPIIETKSDLPYREGQWTPSQQDGKMIYEKDFLLSLRDKPASRSKPPNLPDVIVADERGKLCEGRYSMGRTTDFTNPPFVNNYGGGKSGSLRGVVTPNKRDSKSGKSGGGGGGGKGSRREMPKLTISLREDVKLHEAENAWRPARFHKGDNMSEDERKTMDLYRKVRGVLNKLTPQKFETLVSQIQELKIDTPERLQGVIDLVFEKAVDEPNFSVAYALLCKELSQMQVCTGEDQKEVVNFKKLLITRCQMEFEKQSHDEKYRNDKLKEINECTDPDKKKELQFDIEENDRKIRMKSVGNIRFIGELFKQNMLTVSIMLRCLQNLLDAKDGESLECLCKLLTTIGREIEMSRKLNLGEIFNVMKEIVDKKHGNVSSRVRFMLQDVIDLRKSQWVPRHQDLNPKTIDQIQKEAENEHLNNIQTLNSVQMTPRKDDRGSSQGLNTDRKRRHVSDDGWMTAPTASRNRQFSVQCDKLKNKPPAGEEPLGSRLMFDSWSKGSVIKSDQSVSSTNTANMYAALENMDASEKRPQGSRQSGRNPYSKGPILERNSYKQSYDGRGSSRSGSAQRSSNNSSTPSQKTASAVTVTAPKTVQTSETLTLTEEQLRRRIQNNLEEYLNESCTVEEYDKDTQSFVPPAYLPRMVADGYLSILERSTTARMKTGKLFAKLINLRTLPIEAYCQGLEEILNQADDLQIDIPMIWNCLGEILVHLICEEALPLSRLHKSSELLITQGHGARFLAPLLKLVISEKGTDFLQNNWQASGLSLSDFMPQSQVDSFVKEHGLECVRGGDTPEGKIKLSYEQIYKKLLEFFNVKASFDEIVKWITTNVGERVKDNMFIRMLATAIFENSIVRNKLDPDILQGHYKLLLMYVDANAHYELQCLYALQALSTKLQHPQGLLLSICNKLYEDTTFSQDSFIAWEGSDDPAELKDKGVAIKQLTSFFTSLKENEEDDDDIEDIDDTSASEDA